jgi:hypothetical protein
MMTVQEIERAVTHLSPKQLTRFRNWFEEFDAKLWDAQFERDAKAGKLDEMARQAIADFRAGKSKKL